MPFNNDVRTHLLSSILIYLASLGASLWHQPIILVHEETPEKYSLLLAPPQPWPLFSSHFENSTTLSRVQAWPSPPSSGGSMVSPICRASCRGDLLAWCSMSPTLLGCYMPLTERQSTLVFSLAHRLRPTFFQLSLLAFFSFYSGVRNLYSGLRKVLFFLPMRFFAGFLFFFPIFLFFFFWFSIFCSPFVIFFSPLQFFACFSVLLFF